MREVEDLKGRTEGERCGAPATAESAPGEERHSNDTADLGMVMPSIEVNRPDPDELRHYADIPAEFIPLRPRDKVPSVSNWATRPALSVEEAKAHMLAGGNVGMRLSASDLIIDADPRNYPEGTDALQKLEEDLGLDLGAYPTVLTGGGGKHIVMAKAAEISTCTKLSAYPGLDFKTIGSQIVAAGSVHPNGERYRFDDDPLAMPMRTTPLAPEKLLILLSSSVRSDNLAGGSYSPADLATMLSGLDACDFSDHDDWLKLMMASHHATGGHGREEWIEWSVADPAYTGHEQNIAYRWDSLKAAKQGRAITQNTLFKALYRVGRADLIPRPDAAEDFPDDFSEPVATSGPAAWVWVADTNQFVRRHDGKKYAPEQWKSLFAKDWPEGDILGAVWRDKLPVKKFESLTYLPGGPEFPDGVDGTRYNIWRSSAVRPEPGDVTVFLDHMEYLLPDPAERAHVIDFLALLVQTPRRKIHFALLISGGQGTGKSWLGELMQRVIGARNVTRPSNDEATSRWTRWMEGAELAVIEELMAEGKTDVANRLKPVITDRTIRIEEKNRSLYSIPNHLNLMCFTNHERAVKLEQGDRRWFVVFSPAVPKESAYYDRLFGFLEGAGPSAVSDWLGRRSVRLNPTGVAPLTLGKSQMLRDETDELQVHLSESIQEGVAPFDFDLVRYEDILEQLPRDLANGRNLRHRLTRALHALGAQKHERYTKAGDRPHSALWSIANHQMWTDRGAAKRMDAYLERHG
jgi:hypothetical protein